MLGYDEPALTRQLSGLPPESLAVFAAACAERLAPLYHWACGQTGRGQPEGFDAVLAKLWASIGGSDAATIAANVVRAQALIPDDEGRDWSDPASAFAQNACSALAYATTCRVQGSPRDAQWAARQVNETIMYSFEYRRNPNGEVRAVPAEQARSEIVADETQPLVEAPLASFADDIRDLAADAGPAPARTDAVRAESRAEGAEILRRLT